MMNLKLSKTLSIVLGVILVFAIAALVYIIVAPKVGERFTEFYILGPEGKAANYPDEVALGEEAWVKVSIVNREYREMSYRVVVTIDGVENNEVGPIALAHEEKWEQEVGFRPAKLGERQKVEFILYKDGQPGPSSELVYLWIDVAE